MLSSNTLLACKPLQRTCRICARHPKLIRRNVKPLSIQARRKNYDYEAPDTRGQDNSVSQSASDFASQAYDSQEQQYSQTQGVPQYPPPPPSYQKSAGGGLPSLIWVIVGILIATVVSKVWGVLRHPGGVKGWAMQQAMKAAMGTVPQQGQPGQANPFGAGFPGMPPGMPGMPPGMPPSMGQGWPPAVDTTAQPSGGQQTQASPGQDVSKGQRFQQYRAQEQAKQSSAADSASRPPQAAPMSSSGPSSRPFVAAPKKAASFTDVGDEDESSTASSSSNTSPSTSGSSSSGGYFGDQMPSGFGGSGPQFDQQPQFGQQQQQQQPGASNNNGGSSGSGKQMLSMMEGMMKDPKMQEMLYPYLPEGMRNPQTFEWMLSNPEYRQQLEQMLEAQGGTLSPAMMQNMQGQDMDGYRKQLAQLGMTPDDVMRKILSDPELAQAFNKPDVQAAIMEITANPMAMMKYQQNPEVMQVLNKMQEMFPQGPPKQ